MGEPGIRVRIKLEGLLRCWYVLPTKASSIQDVCDDIVSAFHLRSVCPNGVSLFMDGFALPPTQSILLLSDKDLVSVRPSERLKTVNHSENPSNGHSASNALVDCRKDGGAGLRLNIKKRKERDGEIEQRLSVLTDSEQKKNFCEKNTDNEPESSDSAVTPLSRPIHVPKSPWISFALLFAVLSRQLSCTDMQLLLEEYAEFKRGKISRQAFVEKLKEVVGSQALLKAVSSMHKGPFGRAEPMLQPLACSVECAGGNVADNSTIMPKR